jgi:hypothetical protein
MNANTELQSLIRWQVRIGSVETLLYVCGAREGIDHGTELSEHRVTGVMLYLTTMGFHALRNQVEVITQGPVGLVLIPAHESAIAGYIRIQDGG